MERLAQQLRRSDEPREGGVGDAAGVSTTLTLTTNSMHDTVRGINASGTDMTIGIYSAERSIADAFRLRGEIGYDLAEHGQGVARAVLPEA